MPSEPALPLREKLAYGLGDFASGLYWQSFATYLTFFYTDVFGLSALAAGTMLGLSRSLDAFFDPVMGAVADRTTSRWGKFRPYLLFLSLPLALAGVAAFTVPDLSESGKLVYAWVTFNLVMLLYSAINIPYTALLSVITPSPAERTALASIKFVFAFAAGIVMASMLLPLTRALAAEGAGGAARGWQLGFALIGGAATLFYSITFFATRERVRAPGPHSSSFARDVRDLLSNGPWLLLLGYNLLSNVALAVRSSVVIHYFKYHVGTQRISLPDFLPRIGGTRDWEFEGLVAAFYTGGQLASLLGVVLAPFAAKAIGRKSALLALYFVTLVSVLSCRWLRPDQVGLILGFSWLAALTGGPTSALLWAMYADTIDYAEYKTQRRSAGLAFAAVILASKQGWALGAIVALGLLSSVGFVANAEQSAESLQGLVQAMSVIPAVIGAAALAIASLYPLDEARLEQIEAALRTRRASTEGDVS